MTYSFLKKRLFRIILTGIVGSVGAIALKAQPSQAAERISFSVPIFGEFNLSVDSLEVYAEEGKITQEFDFYAQRFDDKTLTRLRQLLQRRFEVNPTVLYKLTNSAIGERFLRQMGQNIYTHPQRNGLYAIRAAILLAATDQEGLTVTNVMRKFPTKEIQINTKSILSLIKEGANFLSYKESTVKTITEIAEQEITAQSPVNYQQLPDIRQPGKYSVKQIAKTFEIERFRQTTVGFTDSYNLDTDVYLPEDLSQPAPLAIITHGFSSSRTYFQYLAEHLASHGYIVLVPEHIGSNEEYKEAFLRGELSVDVSPIEFYSRPEEIILLLNNIEADSQLNPLINWEQVGIFGHSFGGYTALATAGAPLNQTRINQVCQENKPSLNISLLLQCRASGLPPGDFNNLKDSRIKAVIAANPVTSDILGVEGIGAIDIPTMILGGSEDKVTPFVVEQAHPFLWLKTQHKYLGVMAGGVHTYVLNEPEAEASSGIFANPRPQLRRDYLKAMSLAFFEVHVRNNSDYQPYLSSAYAKHISDRELPLHLVKSLTVEQLEQTYGSPPPTTAIPESIVAATPKKPENVLADIRSTKTLKIAMRSDAPPFGYIDNHQDLWTGYCSGLADSLGSYLSDELNIPNGIDVKTIPSTLENRFELVANNTAHLECGPNTINPDMRDVSFSKPFFITGTRFLVAKDNANKIDLNNNLEGIQTGVLQDSTTAEYIQSTYPKAKTVLFQGTKGRIEGIKAITNGEINAFAGDGVLLLGELARQNLDSKDYQLIPEQPLTCDLYGLILPQGQNQWNSLVNKFIDQDKTREVNNEWLKDYFDQALSDGDYCLNQRK